MRSPPGARFADAALRLWAFGECYNSNAAAFLSAGSAHPRLIRLGPTFHLAEHISGVFGR